MNKILKYCLLIIVLIFIFQSFKLSSKTFIIGEDSEYKFCSSVENLVTDGDTVLIEAGIYFNDKQVTWRANDLLIRGIKGRPILQAGEKIAKDMSNGKGIFVIKGNNTWVENIKFIDARVVDNNGAGIRQEGRNLIVRYCEFENNEMGILQGGTINDCTILIEHCKFVNSGSSDNPGYQHNVYINHIDTLIFRFNESYDAIAEGHELKSRADNNFIIYNIISNINSIDSRNIDLPNGGTALIMGNVIEQSNYSANSGIIGFGLEGLINNAPHNLWIVNNTIVNNKIKGNFINVANIDTLFLKNNICVGAMTGGFITGQYKLLDSSNNFIDKDLSAVKFINENERNYVPGIKSPAINNGIKIDKYVGNYYLKPEFEILSVDSIRKRFDDGNIDIGAYEYIPEMSKVLSQQDEFIIYPNPCNDVLYIKSKRFLERITLYDILGCEVLEIRLNEFETQIDLNHLHSGIYFLQIENKIYKIFKE